MKYFDTHTHTNDSVLDKEFNTIRRIMNNENAGMNIIGVDLESSKLAVEQAVTHPNFYASVGIHPDNIMDNFSADLVMYELEKLYYSAPNKVKCIGECGIDLYHNKENLDDQIFWFKKHFELAKKLDLILMIHARDAYTELLGVLKTLDLSGMRIIIHCFTGNVQQAKEFQRLGCYISVGGIVTFKNGEVLKDVVRNVDLNLVVTETDAPYLAPTPFRGNTNFPYYVKYVNEFIARVLNMDLDKFNNHMMSNIKKLFRL